MRSSSTKNISENQSIAGSSNKESPIVIKKRFSSFARAKTNDSYRGRGGSLMGSNTIRSKHFKISKSRMNRTPINKRSNKTSDYDSRRQSVYSSDSSPQKRSNFRVNYRPNSIFMKRKQNIGSINDKFN